MAGKPVNIPVLSDLEKDILTAALDEFWKKGYHQGSVDAIAGKLKIGKGTIYRHFGNKFRLFLNVMNFFLDKATESAKAVVSIVDFREAYHAYMDRLIRINGEVGEFMLVAGLEESALHLKGEIRKDPRIRKGFQEMLDKRRLGVQVLAGILKRGKAARIIDPAVDCDIRAEIIVSAVINFIREYYSTCALGKCLGVEKQYELQAGLTELKKFIDCGLGLEPGGKA